MNNITEPAGQWAISVWNSSTLEYVTDPHAGDVELYPSKDEAKRALQAWLISEADGTVDDEDSAMLLDDAAQTLNYADVARIGGVFDWDCEVVQHD